MSSDNYGGNWSSQSQQGRHQHQLPMMTFASTAGTGNVSNLLPPCDPKTPDRCSQVVVSVGGEIDEYDIHTRGQDTDKDGERSACVDDDDVPEIGELRKVLNDLVSTRNIENIFNSNYDHKFQKGNQSSILQTNNDTTANEDARDKNDELLYSIPNFVNRVLIEHFSSIDRSHARADGSITKRMTGNQEKMMIHLLLAVILEFSEPYFVRVVRHHRHKEKMNIQQQQSREGKRASRRRKKNTLPESNNEQQSSNRFDERAVSWAIACIAQLIQPRTASTCSSTRIGKLKYYDEVNHASALQRTYNNYNIPELDALLTISGPHDGLKAEKQMQSGLMQCLQCRRLLQSMNMLGNTEFH